MAKGKNVEVVDEVEAGQDETVETLTDGILGESEETQETNESQEENKQEESKLLRFIRVWEECVKDGSRVAGVAKRLGLRPGTVQAMASTLRNNKYKMVDKLHEGKTVYRSKDGGETGETLNIEDAKRDKAGKAVRVKVFAFDEKGEKIVVRAGIPLSNMPRGGGGKSVSSQMNEALALLAELKQQK